MQDIFIFYWNVSIKNKKKIKISTHDLIEIIFFLIEKCLMLKWITRKISEKEGEKGRKIHLEIEEKKRKKNASKTEKSGRMQEKK